MELGAIQLLRWALYADLGLLFGMPLFGIYSPGVEAVPRRLLRVLAIAGIALTLASLQFTAAAMADAPVMQVDPQLLASVVGQTGFGLAGLARLVLLAALVAVSLNSVNAEWLAAALGGGALATLAWGGHGVSTSGSGGAVHLAADLIHLLAAGAWLGALAMFLRTIRSDARASHAALKQFAAVGTVTVAALAASGFVNAAFRIDLDRRGWAPTNLYERLLLLKLVLFDGMLVLATINRFLLTPRMAAQETTGNVTRVRQVLRLSILAEFVLALGVLALVALLGTLDPAA